MIIKELKVVIILCLLSSNAMATSLSEALANTYQTNPDLIAAREELKKVDEQIYKAISGFLPKLDYEAKKTNSKVDTGRENGQLIKQDEWVHTKSKKSDITLEQNVFNGGRSIMAVQVAKYTIESGRAALLSKEQEILLKAINAYLNIIYSKQNLEINKENVQAYEKKYQSIKEKFDAGFSKSADLASALSKKADAETNLAHAQGEYNSDIATYLQVVGLEPSNIALEGSLTNIPANQMELLQKSLQENPDLLKVAFLQKAADLNIKYNAAAMLPSVDVGGRISKFWEADSNKNIPQPYSNSKSVYISVKMPIYNRGVEYSNIRFSKADAAKLKYDFKNIKAVITQKSTKSWSDYIVAKEMIKSAQEAVKAGTMALNGKQKEYEEGLASLTEVLELQENLFKYRLKLTQAVKNLELKRYEIAVLMGELNAKKLALPTKIYNASANYDKVKMRLVGF